MLTLLCGWALAEGPPGFVDDLLRQAETMRTAGRYDEALGVLRRARDIDPNDARVGNLYQRILVGKSAAEPAPAAASPSPAPATPATAVNPVSSEPVVKPIPLPKPKAVPTARMAARKPANVPPHVPEAVLPAPTQTGAAPPLPSGPGHPESPAGWLGWRVWAIPAAAGLVLGGLGLMILRQARRLRQAGVDISRLQDTIARATEQAAAARAAETRAREETSARLDAAAQDLSRRLAEARAGWERETAAALEHAAQARGEAEGKMLDKEAEASRAKSELAEVSKRLRDSERKAKTREEALQAELTDKLSRELGRVREELEALATRREAELRSLYESKLRAAAADAPGFASSKPVSPPATPPAGPTSREFHPGQAEIVAQALHLYRINPERGLATLRDLARDPNPAVRRSIAPALEAIGTPEALSLLTGLGPTAS